MISTFDEYQKLTPHTAMYPSDQALEYLALGLASEAGEVAGKIKKKIRDGEFDPAELSKELGDCFWYLSQLANELRIPLDLIADQNIKKLMDRKSRDVISGSGDNR